jgi:hypothetical protein
MTRRCPYTDATAREMERWPGVTYTFDAQGKHNRVVLTYAGRSHFLPFPRTGSDHRGPLNHVAALRRVLVGMGAVRAPGVQSNPIFNRRSA